MQHLLIDFETVQPVRLDSYNPADTCVWLLLGSAQQESLPLDLCESLCRFGNNVHFVRVRGGAGALAVHLAFRLGKILSDNPEATFTVLSANEAYDGLLTNLLPATGQRITALPDGEVAADDETVSETETPAAEAVEAVAEVEAVEQVEQQQQAEDAAEAVEEAPAEENAVEEVAPVEEVAEESVTEVAETAEAAEEESEAEHVGNVLEKYYPAVVQAMSQKDAYHPRHRRNLAANIERYLVQYEHEIGGLKKEELAEQVIVHLEHNGLVKDLGDGLLSYHFDSAAE
ncbi:PIN domain-containing protein [Conchiformibius steedae DSM 2580]|uniref:PIN domain-containing protein n=1 Tax=Conchiformibius steedae DSM 2580 TaxID=1121352 RepID=A0AAE9HT03_9NEIS|nr:PIN domain-containing protein [Conchiformibius steedae]QMT34390.1 hypothetical protein H3L98_05330 [Conchiformibius steedae]URD67168.1 PIN domain-containing protein [Conchiformibius steedae DSM 2580]